MNIRILNDFETKRNQKILENRKNIFKLKYFFSLNFVTLKQN